VLVLHGPDATGGVDFCAELPGSDGFCVCVACAGQNIRCYWRSWTMSLRLSSSAQRPRQMCHLRAETVTGEGILWRQLFPSGMREVEGDKTR